MNELNQIVKTMNNEKKGFWVCGTCKEEFNSIKEVAEHFKEHKNLLIQGSYYLHLLCEVKNER